jgi:hypothetical protein
MAIELYQLLLEKVIGSNNEYYAKWQVSQCVQPVQYPIRYLSRRGETTSVATMTLAIHDDTHEDYGVVTLQQENLRQCDIEVLQTRRHSCRRVTTAEEPLNVDYANNVLIFAHDLRKKGTMPAEQYQPPNNFSFRPCAMIHFLSNTERLQRIFRQTPPKVL